ncbi:MAG: MerR family transcriptional regulator [Kofleriaceae bacterium]|nr:MerR family transcriptional regulator [Kofleriaceae bacterium]
MSWTLSELTAEVARHIAALPEPANGQVRAVPDERNIRYYTTLGLLDRPLAMRGRTALYGARHAAQVVAIKRMQAAGKSLAQIAALWPTLDVAMLEKISGIALQGSSTAKVVVAPPVRREFWKRSAVVVAAESGGGLADAVASTAVPAAPNAPIYVVPSALPASSALPHLPLRRGVSIDSTMTIELTDAIRLLLPAANAEGVQLDLDRIIAAAAPLLDELVRQRVTTRIP